MIVLVCGGRDYADESAVFEVLDRVHGERGIELVIEGDAPGADTFAGNWADSRRVHCARVRALWRFEDGRTDRGAGPKRNRAMLKLRPDGVIAFPGGKGTADMVAAAEAAGIKVWKPKG